MIPIKISSDALADLKNGHSFYEKQEDGLGNYFASQISADIDGLKITSGIHRQPYRDLHRVLSRRFPYAIFYQFSNETVLIVAIIDCRRDPGWIKTHLDRQE